MTYCFRYLNDGEKATIQIRLPEDSKTEWKCIHFLTGCYWYSEKYYFIILVAEIISYTRILEIVWFASLIMDNHQLCLVDHIQISSPIHPHINQGARFVFNQTIVSESVVMVPGFAYTG